MRHSITTLRPSAERVGLGLAILVGLTAGFQPLRAATSEPPEPNCANGKLLCREVSTCVGGKFDNQGRCDGAMFTIYYYYRGT